MRLKLSRLRLPEWVVGTGGLVLLASMLALPWYGVVLVSGPPRRGRPVLASVDGWDGVTHLRWLLLATILASLALLVLQATRRAPALPATFSLVAMVLGAVTTAWLLYRVAIAPAGGRQAGGWVALVAATAVACGAYSSLRREGIAPADGPQEIPAIDPRSGARF